MHSLRYVKCLSPSNLLIGFEKKTDRMVIKLIGLRDGKQNGVSQEMAGDAYIKFHARLILLAFMQIKIIILL